MPAAQTIELSKQRLVLVFRRATALRRRAAAPSRRVSGAAGREQAARGLLDQAPWIEHGDLLRTSAAICQVVVISSRGAAAFAQRSVEARPSLGATATSRLWWVHRPITRVFQGHWPGRSTGAAACHPLIHGGKRLKRSPAIPTARAGSDGRAWRNRWRAQRGRGPPGCQ